MAKIKNTRLITNRNFPDGKSVEWIEIDPNGIMYWKSEDWSFHLFYSNFTKDDAIHGSFPVTLEFVEDFFEKNGRKFDVTLLPKNLVANPYAMNM